MNDDQKQRRTEFKRMLAVLDAHPERWAILRLSVESWPLTEKYSGSPALEQFANVVLRVTQDALKEFGMDVDVNTARALLAAQDMEM
jgi:hypothetical protein